VNNLASALPRLLPFAIAWVQLQEAEVLANGRALSDAKMKLAVAVGVQHSDRVRIKVATQLPQPHHPELLAIGKQTGLLGPRTGGITFGPFELEAQRHECDAP
jgi:hypothetical protein